MNKSYYVPMNKLVTDRKSEWTFTQLEMPYIEIARHGIITWCYKHLEGRWTMLGGNKFAFEDSNDALMFKIQFDGHIKR